MYWGIIVAVSVSCVVSSPLSARRDKWSQWKDKIQQIANDVDLAVKRAAVASPMMGKREFIVGKRNVRTNWEANIAEIAHNAGQTAEMATFTTLMTSAMTVSKRDDHYWNGLKDDFLTVAKAVGTAVESTVAKVLHETGLKTSRETNTIPWTMWNDLEDLLKWYASFYNWHPMTSTEINEWYPKSESTDTHNWQPPETDTIEMIDASTQTEVSS